MYNIVILSRKPNGTWHLGDNIYFAGTYLDKTVTVSMLTSEWVKLTEAYQHDQGQIMNWLEYKATQEVYALREVQSGLEIRLSY